VTAPVTITRTDTPLACTCGDPSGPGGWVEGTGSRARRPWTQ
jgi:hypothetical protein